jgi:hypothetical protein
MRYLLIGIFLSISVITKAQIVITSEQLRETNLIFLEHKQFKQQIPLLKLQIDNLKQIDYSWRKTDSINQSIIYNYKNQLIDKDKSIDNLNKSLKINQNIIIYGGSVSIITIILCLLLK